MNKRTFLKNTSLLTPAVCRCAAEDLIVPAIQQNCDESCLHFEQLVIEYIFDGFK